MGCNHVDTERIKTDYRQDALPMSAGLYEAFLAKGATGKDALLCYLHLLWTYRKQGTNQPWAVSEYLENGLKLSPKRVRLAKGLLSGMGLIEHLRDRTKHGRLGKVYTKLNLVSAPRARTRAADSLTTGAPTAPVEKSPEITTGAVSPPVVPVRQVLKERIRDAVASSEAPARARNPDYAASLHCFRTLYQEKNIGPCPWNYGKDGAHLKGDLVEFGIDRLTRAMRLFFSDDCPREARRFAERPGVGFTYGVFRSQIKRGLIAILDAEDHRLSLIRVCPVCGKHQEHTGQDCIGCGADLRKGVRNVN